MMSFWVPGDGLPLGPDRAPVFLRDLLTYASNTILSTLNLGQLLHKTLFTRPFVTSLRSAMFKLALRRYTMTY
jgi:hypothetical protein